MTVHERLYGWDRLCGWCRFAHGETHDWPKPVSAAEPKDQPA